MLKESGQNPNDFAHLESRLIVMRVLGIPQPARRLYFDDVSYDHSFRHLGVLFRVNLSPHVGIS
jgi:hypothetical protein